MPAHGCTRSYPNRLSCQLFSLLAQLHAAQSSLEAMLGMDCCPAAGTTPAWAGCRAAHPAQRYPGTGATSLQIYTGGGNTRADDRSGAVARDNTRLPACAAIVDDAIAESVEGFTLEAEVTGARLTTRMAPIVDNGDQRPSRA